MPTSTFILAQQAALRRGIRSMQGSRAMTDTEKLREQFEAWARKNELEAERHKYADDQYDDHAATSAWWAWRDAFQAGHAAAKAETAAAVATEREHCALVCEDVRRAVAEINGAGVAAAQQCADAIRAGAHKE